MWAPTEGKRPSRGPMISNAARATQPPTLCTTVEPAKSINPICANHPDAVPD